MKTFTQRVTDAYMEAIDFTETPMFEDVAGICGAEFHGYSTDMNDEAVRQVSDFLDYLTRTGLMDEVVERLSAEQIGHDFWLTRNHHGAGFWDRGLEALGERLTAAAQTFGDGDVYLGDDGWVHFA